MSGISGGEPADGLAPVIPLFAHAPGGRAVREADVSRPQTLTEPHTPEWRTTWDDDPDDEYGVYDEDDGYDACGAIEREIAEKNLLKRLRTRQLSVVEARAVVAERALGPADVESILEAFCRRGYLDDVKLAEHLTHIGIDRKGQGRQIIAQTLARRGIPRDVADAALAALPDDDAERALAYARSKAASMAQLDRAVAMRRLAGQLARRGYPGSVALDAARRALDAG